MSDGVVTDPNVPRIESLQLEHLAYGWYAQNLDRSGTGFGVFAYSTRWPRELGTEAMELGSLTKKVSTRGDLLYTRMHRGHRLLIRNIPVSGGRQGTYLVHIIDISSPVIDMIGLLQIIESGLPYASMDSFADRLPTAQATPLGVHPARMDAPKGGLSDVLAALLVCGDGRGSGVRFGGAAIDVVNPDLAAAYGVLPRRLRPDLEVRSWRPQASAASQDVTELTMPHGSTRETAFVDLRWSARGWQSVTAIDEYRDLANELLTLVEGGYLPPEDVASFDRLHRWVTARRLMTVSPQQLSDAEVVTILAGSEDARAWLDDPFNAQRAIVAAVNDPGAAGYLDRLHRKRSVLGLEQQVCGELYARDLTGEEMNRVLKAFGIEWNHYTDLAVERFLTESKPGFKISQQRADVVFPVLSARDDLLRRPDAVIDDLLTRFSSFRRMAASSADSVVLNRLVDAEFAGRPEDCDWTLLGRIADRDPGMIVDSILSGRDATTVGGHLRSVLENLPIADSAEICLSVVKTRAGTGVVLDALTSAAMQAERRTELLAAVWPTVAASLGIPQRIQRMLRVVDESNGSDPKTEVFHVDDRPWPERAGEIPEESPVYEQRGWLRRLLNLPPGRRTDQRARDGGRDHG